MPTKARRLKQIRETNAESAAKVRKAGITGTIDTKQAWETGKTVACAKVDAKK